MTVERTKEMAPPLAALFFVSAAAVGFEIQLTRFFSIASWSEYGYWVISIVMVGFAASGVVLSLFESWFLGRARHLLKVLPLLLVPAAVLGFYLVTLVPFNPLSAKSPRAASMIRTFRSMLRFCLGMRTRTLSPPNPGRVFTAAGTCRSFQLVWP